MYSVWSLYLIPPSITFDQFDQITESRVKYQITICDKMRWAV